MDALQNLGGATPGPGLGAPAFSSRLGFSGFGGASARCCNGTAGMPAPDPMSMMMQQQMMMQQFMMLMMQLLLTLMRGRGKGGGLPGGSPGVGGLPGRGGGRSQGGGARGANGSSGGGSSDSGPVKPGTAGLLEHANRMVGLEENRDTRAIQSVTGKSGINPSTTPWCAAWAMNLLEQHGVLKLDGLSNRNYVPTIKSWGKSKNIWQEGGQYKPKAGDAIAFDWNHDGTPDHIGIVERVSGGKVYTIEGNSSDRVKKNSYAIGDGRIDGYLKT